MGINRGPNATRPKKDPRFNRRSASQRLRRAKEKEALLKLPAEQKVNDRSFQDCLQKMASVDFKHTIFGDSKILYEGSTNSYHSFQEFPRKLPNKDNIPTMNSKNQDRTGSSNLPDYFPLTTVVNSVPVSRHSISGPSNQNQKKLLKNGLCRNKSSAIPNRSESKSFSSCKSKEKEEELGFCGEQNIVQRLTGNMGKKRGPNAIRPRKNPRFNRRSASQRLRRAKEKEALLKLLANQKVNDGSFQDSSLVGIKIDSRPSRNCEMMNIMEKNHKHSDTLQKITIIDSVSVIKTELIDPSETNNWPTFQNYSQSAIPMCPMPKIMTEIRDIPRKNESFLLPNIKVEKTQISNETDKFSWMERPFSNISNTGTSSSFKRNDLPKDILLTDSKKSSTADFLESFKTPKLKKQFGTGLHNNTMQKYSVFSKAVCSCFKNKDVRRQQQNFKTAQDDHVTRLCLCKSSNHSLAKNRIPSEEEEVLKRFCLENPDFGKITNNMRTKLC